MDKDASRQYDWLMKILFVAAEVAPYVSVGGLSQVVYFLSRSLIAQGHDVRIFTARYGTMTANAPGNEPWSLDLVRSGLEVPVAHDNLPPETPAPASPTETAAGTEVSSTGPTAENGGITCDVLSHRPKKGDALCYFLDNKEYYELRANVFGYADDDTRFALLSKGCLEWLRDRSGKRAPDGAKAWMPDVIHCHDWHTSYLIDLARRDRRYRTAMAQIPIVLTVHNFKYQGIRDYRYVREEDKDDGLTPLEPLRSARLAAQNALKRGLIFADAVTTVSPTHAVEVLTPEYAEGLEDTLQRVRGKLSGILNGIDTKEFDPATDPLVRKRFSAARFEAARAENKRFLQKTFSLEEDPKRPLLGYVGRIAAQKGWDLLLAALPPLLEERPEVQLVVLGSGDDRYRAEIGKLKERFPEQIGAHLLPDFRLPRRIFSGADLMLIPSLFEPGGIVALEALRYGAVPLVRRTGGLNDSVTDFDPETRRGDGFSFANKDPWSLYGAIVEALTIHRQPRTWKRLVGNCLAQDFSWDHAAGEYEDWYRQAIRDRTRRRSRRFYENHLH